MKGNYTAIAAKLKAIGGTRLDSDDFMELLTKSSVSDVYAYLVSHTGYAQVLSDLKNEQIHRTEIEKRLRREMLLEYSRIYSFMDTDQKKMFEFWFARREIEFLKRTIKYLYNHESRENEDKAEEYFIKHTKLDCKMLEEADTLDKVIEACGATPYAKVLKRAQNIEADYFSLSMLLDRFYYDSAWKAKNKLLSGKDRELFEDIFGMEIDINNIIWIYRGKKYFNMTQEMIISYLIPRRYRLSSDTVRKLLSASSDADFIKALQATAYEGLFEGVGEGFFPEENKNRLYAKKARSILQNEPRSMAAVYSYFELKEFEIYNITVVIESIRYDIDRQSIGRHLCLS